MWEKQIQISRKSKLNFCFFHKSKYFELFYANLSFQQKCESPLATGGGDVVHDAEGHPIVHLALLVLFSLSFSYFSLPLDCIVRTSPAGVK
jgi:hypothetical protein